MKLFTQAELERIYISGRDVLIGETKAKLHSGVWTYVVYKLNDTFYRVHYKSHNVIYV